MSRTHYTRAPIAEAVIDLRVVPEDGGSVEALANMADRLTERFPVRNNLAFFQIGLHITGDGAPPQSVNTPLAAGFRLDSANGDRVLQIRMNGLTYSWLPPYDTWEAFSAEAKPLWQQFTSSTKPKSVGRVAIRMVNRIAIPEEGRIERYFSVYPCGPENLLPLIGSFYLQLQMVAPTNGKVADARAIVNFAVSPIGDTKKREILLDLDLFVQREFGNDDPGIWETLDVLSAAKNELFESFITDTTRELIR